MLNMKYIGSEDNYTVNFRNISKSVAELKGDFPVKTTGFTLSRIGKNDNWDYSTYITVYREIEGGVQYSSDGSIYVEPVETPTPYVPTEAETKKMEIVERIAEIDTWFTDHDYIGIKIATGRATAEEYAETIAQMDEYAKEKEVLRTQLKELEAGEEEEG